MPRAGVPADLRARLEQARLDTLALLRALDHALGSHAAAPTAPLAILAEADADCAEALWALDEPPSTLDLGAMVRDTTATLATCPARASTSARRCPRRRATRSSALSATSARRSTRVRPTTTSQGDTPKPLSTPPVGCLTVLGYGTP